MDFCKLEENLYVGLSKWSVYKKVDLLAYGLIFLVCNFPYEDLKFLRKLGSVVDASLEAHHEKHRDLGLQRSKDQVRKPETSCILPQS